MSGGRKHRSRASAYRVIGVSASYQRENLLARGLGLEHLRELLIRLARPLLRQSASLAYGGHWKDTEDNFTYDLLGLISAEQEDNSLGGPDTNLTIGRLVNHSAWPAYLQVTPRIEAQWINCCRIVRITQKHAGIEDAHAVADADAAGGSDRALLNAAIALSAMRRFVVDGISIDVPDLPSPETVPPIAARVALAGSVHGYTGFFPGIFEETLVTLERNIPLYLLGGFGGAAEILARTLLAPPGTRPRELTVEWHAAANPRLAKLLQLSENVKLPPGARATSAGLEQLMQRIEAARASLSGALGTGLNEGETRELLVTRDMKRAVQLVLMGLDNKLGVVALPA